MKLETIAKNPEESWLYLERYVNKGSPSGFTRKYHPPDEFDPFSDTESFKLPQLLVNKKELITYGEYPVVLETPSEKDNIELSSFFMHPIIYSHKKFAHWVGVNYNKLNIYSFLNASPTASGRTIWLHGLEKLIHLKLHYPGILCRVNRELPFKKAIAGPELWFAIKPFLDSGKAPKTLSFFPEVAARMWNPLNGNLNSIGLIVRDAKPYPYKKNRYIIPFFSLFSKDTKSPNDRLLIYQLLDIANNPAEFLYEKILKAVIESYCYLTFKLGIMPEINAQNILLELSPNFMPTRVILRDISRMEKNLHLRRKLGLQTNFKSNGYKIIDAEVNREYSEIRHSFSYDFKLSYYIIAELIDCCAKEYRFNADNIDQKVKELFWKLASEEIFYYFPSGNVWYSHDNILLTNKRSYTKNKNPRFRRCIND